MIDFHCHLDLYPNPQAVISQVAAKNIYVLAVTTTPKALAGIRGLIGNQSRIRIAIGLHPELVAERHNEVMLVCEKIPEYKYVGEIGLDGTPAHKSSLPLQRKVFEQILSSCGEHGGRIMSIHSRGAVSLVLDCLARQPRAGKPVLHWFSGTQGELNRAVELGCYFSVGPLMLQNQRGLNLCRMMPQERILTESDGPLAESKGKALMPWDVQLGIDKLSNIWGITQVESERLIHNNFKRILA